MSTSDIDIKRSQFLGPTGWFTKSLFFEKTLPATRSADTIYTLKDFDIVRKDITYRSLYLLYMNCQDPTEYEFATKHLGGWAHLEQLRNIPWFAEKLNRWQEEFSIRTRSEAVIRMIDIAEDGGNYQANKLLIDKGWIEKTAAGRPTKAQVSQKLKEDKKIKSTISTDIAKLRDYRKNK